MRYVSLILVVCILLATGAAPAQAAEYFVSKQGSDDNDGRSREAALRTIQKGVDALEPGDTLTIGSGEYHESVEREDLGSDERDTIIRAAIPGTVLLRGDVPAPAFVPVQGYRFVYVAEFDGEVQAVNEVDTLKILQTAPSVAELEFTPGGCYYDADAKRLYISSSDLQPPDMHHYTVGVTPEHGLYLAEPTRVIIEGLAATGYQSARQKDEYPGYRAAWGILLGRANDSVIRKCTAYLNGGGIAFNESTHQTGSGDNLIEYCQAYGNYTRHSGEGGNLLIFNADNGTIRHSYAHTTETQGIRIYGGGIRGPAILRHNLAWGNESADIWIKGGRGNELGLAENNVALGNLQVHKFNHNIHGVRNKYNPEPDADNIQLGTEADLDEDEEFADPANLDFRLQATSRFRGAGPAGTDRGAFPYEANIFYIAPGGDDGNDGLSVGSAWRSLDHALTQLRAGDTLYLEGGPFAVAETPLPAAATQDEPIHIRGRGETPVMITGSLRLMQAAGVTFERLHFTEPVDARDSKSLTFKNCIFRGTPTSLRASGSTGLRVSHGLFHGFTEAAIDLAGSEAAFLSGNIYANEHGPALLLDEAAAVRYADYNSYQNADAAWRRAGEAMSLDALQPDHESQSHVLTPELVFEGQSVRLSNAERFAGRGPHGTAIGLYHAYRKRDLRLEGPFVHSATDTTATIEWWASVPAQFDIAWGDTPECANRERIVTNQFASFSLTDLVPGASYYFRIISATPIRSADAVVTRPLEPSSSPLSFTTNSSPAKRTNYYVATDGNDRNSGLSPEDAWRTVSHAADRANAGDTVLIAGGRYSESVRVRATGQPDHPITFKAMPGERVVFDGNDRAILTAFDLTNKHHIHIDGFYFVGFGKHRGEGGVISLNRSNHARITRCYMNGKGPGYPNPFIYSTGDDLLVRNCVIAEGFHGMLLYGDGSVRIEHNVFLRNMIQAMLLTPRAAKVRFNIFVDSKSSKVRVPLLSGPSGRIDVYDFQDNAFLLRVPDEQRAAFVFYKDRASYHYGSPERLSVAEYERRTGNTGNVVIDPRFQIGVGHELPSDASEDPPFVGDWVHSQIGLADFDFDDLFTTHPQLVERGIGLVPEDFHDFHFDDEASQRRATAGDPEPAVTDKDQDRE